MIKITIDYKDFDDHERQEDFWFHLTEAEIAEWHLTYEGNGEDMTEYLKRIIASEEKKELIKLFKGLIHRSIGKRSEDGRRFMKSQDITDDFMQTNAYSVFFMRLATDAVYAANYFNGIVPKGMVEKAMVEAKLPETEEDTRPAWIKENREPTKNELMNMSPAEMKEAFLARVSK